MIIFREHKGGLSESMATAKEFNGFDEMKAYIVKIHTIFYKALGHRNAPFETSDIVIDMNDKTEDNRIGWHDEMHVCVKRYGEKDYIKLYNSPQCIGMCATDYDK